MKKTIVAIYGSANLGKTTCIKKFFENFTVKHSSEILNINNLPEYKNDGDDIAEIIILQNNVKIGVCSYGDNGANLETLKKLSEENCKVIVCATRTKGSSTDSIYGIKNYDIKWISKAYFYENYSDAESEVLNNSFSNCIFDLVEYYLSH